MEYHSGGSLPLLGRPRYCPGANANGGYLCETGHCCGETGCCTYYYELWWFWLLWTVLILFSCCCAYRHRRAKLRVQQQQRQREISLLAYHGASSYPSSMLDLSFLASLKLPSYEEVAAQPSTPPPPYSSVFTTPRYPQPPRTTDPHLLTQHGPLLHQTLSDGPSSLSSDNSSSCSCDSCCPSSPCSSSLSAPVTYETDTSHATTPSEAVPFTLDVTMETIAAAANCLEVNQTQFDSERMVATVAIDISDEAASEAQEPIATDSSVPNKTVTVALVTTAVPTHPLPLTESEVALPVETLSPVKLDLVPCTQHVSLCSPNTLPSPSVGTTLSDSQKTSTEGPTDIPQTTHQPKVTSLLDPSTTTACNSDIPAATEAQETLHPSNTFDSASVPSSPSSVPSTDVKGMIAASPGVSTQDPIPSLVPITAPSNLTRASSPVPANLTQAPDAVPTKYTPDPDLVPLDLTQFSVPVLTNLTQDPDPVPSNRTQMSIQVSPNLTQATAATPTHFVQESKLVYINLTPFPDPVQTAVTQAPDQVPSKLTPMPNSQRKTPVAQESSPYPIITPKPADLNPTLATDPAPPSPVLVRCQSPELSPGSGLSLGLGSPRSGSPQHPGTVTALVSCLDAGVMTADSGPSLVLPLLSESDLTGSLPLKAQAGLDTGSGLCSNGAFRSSPLSTPAQVLVSPTHAASSSSCPTIPGFSFAYSQSPPTVLSPSPPSPPLPPSSPSLPSAPALSPTGLPAPALLLDPLTALHQPNRGGSSSGHASSLSPSPRASQSPPKQTLFSPCVDIFEPGPESWDDEEEKQDQEDNDDDEDEDMGADESQYRHRRLTGDSGIEVCRCQVKEEEEEEEEDEKGKRTEDGRRAGGGERDKKGGGKTDLHDSADCPARSQIATDEGLLLCNSTSTTAPTAEDGGKVVLVMETV